MKVGNSGDKGVGGVSSTRAVGEGHGAAKGSESKKTQHASGESKGATVTLSKAASSLMAAGGANGDFDADKVAAVKQSISDGTYKINHEAIADKLIANAKELLSGKSH